MAYTKYDMFTHELQVHVACHFNCLIENDGTLQNW